MFIDPLKNLALMKNLLRILKTKTPISTYGIIDENLGHMVYALNQHVDKQILIITYDDRKAKRIYEDIKNFDENVVELFPNREILFYKVDALSTEVNNQRLKVLTRLILGESIIVIASIESILNKLIDPGLFKQHMINIKQGDKVELDLLIQGLISCGYERSYGRRCRTI